MRFKDKQVRLLSEVPGPTFAQRGFIDGTGFNLPTLRAFRFPEKNITAFDNKESAVPLVLVVNLIGPCNLRCAYCLSHYATRSAYTSFSSESLGLDTPLRPLERNDFEEIFRQYGRLGGSTILLSSTGEPFLDFKFVAKLAKLASENGLQLAVFTNGTMFDQTTAQLAHELGINLLFKLDAGIPELNDLALGSKGRYEYVKFNGLYVPSQLVTVLKEYGRDMDMVAACTSITTLNYDYVLPLREWALKLGIPQFLKHIYPVGAAENRPDLFPTQGDIIAIHERILELDEKYGLTHPSQIPEKYHYDMRRAMGAILNNQGFPLRIDIDCRGGAMIVTDVIQSQIGKLPLIRLLDAKDQVDLEAYFKQADEHIRRVLTH
ncbi:MAG: radical SAM protein [Candidatus Micrarchaeia archaeon]|jgi:MoaA/NifB/PqqE/SkfB family radical SAM enzyme